MTRSHDLAHGPDTPERDRRKFFQNVYLPATPASSAPCSSRRFTECSDNVAEYVETFVAMQSPDIGTAYFHAPSSTWPHQVGVHTVLWASRSRSDSPMSLSCASLCVSIQTR